MKAKANNKTATASAAKASLDLFPGQVQKHIIVSREDYPIGKMKPIGANVLLNVVDKKNVGRLVGNHPEKGEPLSRAMKAVEAGYRISGGILLGKHPKEIKVFWAVTIDNKPFLRFGKLEVAIAVSECYKALKHNAALTLVYDLAEKKRLTVG